MGITRLKVLFITTPLNAASGLINKGTRDDKSSSDVTSKDDKSIERLDTANAFTPNYID